MCKQTNYIYGCNDSVVVYLVEEEQARERYIKRMNNRNLHGSISSNTSSQNQEINYISLPAGEPMLSPAITDPMVVPGPPPPSPEVPGYIQKEMERNVAFVSF